jgi:methylenetetrahydrofolate--tRNA-(uracil-5-)-methyltransferase
VFGLIPGLEHAEYMRYGVMHRNTFLNSPKVLTSGFAFRENPNLFFSGQITGVEGYMESAASGIMAGVNAVRRMRGIEPLTLPATTMIGALSRYVESGGAGDFQPMGANFGIIPPLAERIRDKRERYAALAARALKDLDRTLAEEKQRFI